MSHKTATAVIKRLGVDYDKEVLEWKALAKDEDPADQVCDPGSNSTSTTAENPITAATSGAVNDSLPSTATSTSTTSAYPPFILVGDNWNKTINPRDMRIDHQTQSMNYFHSYAALDRIDFSGFSSSERVGDISSLPVSAFVPSAVDCKCFRSA